MFIVPITTVNSLDGLGKIQKATMSEDGNGLPFQSIFEDAINNVRETQSVVDEEALKLATGQTDDVANLSIASTKASLALDLMVQIRNKTLESYNEIMRMNV